MEWRPQKSINHMGKNSKKIISMFFASFPIPQMKRQKLSSRVIILLLLRESQLRMENVNDKLCNL